MGKIQTAIPKEQIKVLVNRKMLTLHANQRNKKFK